MTSSSDLNQPPLLEVNRLIASRYPNNVRPASWDARVDGFDIVEDCCGRQIKLISSGMQSPPAKGCKLVLLEGDPESGYKWTLYGLPA